jgi:hypothetical protein
MIESVFDAGNLQHGLDSARSLPAIRCHWPGLPAARQMERSSPERSRIKCGAPHLIREFRASDLRGEGGNTLACPASAGAAAPDGPRSDLKPFVTCWIRAPSWSLAYDLTRWAIGAHRLVADAADLVLQHVKTRCGHPRLRMCRRTHLDRMGRRPTPQAPRPWRCSTDPNGLKSTGEPGYG